MRTENIRVKLRDGEMGAYIAYPDKTPAGAVIAIMEIWGVNDTMRHHAHEFAEAGFICLVPDLFWRQEPGVELSDRDPEQLRYLGALGIVPGARVTVVEHLPFEGPVRIRVLAGDQSADQEHVLGRPLAEAVRLAG